MQRINRDLPSVHCLSDTQKEAAIARGRELVARARQRNEGISADVLAKEVQDAI